MFIAPNNFKMIALLLVLWSASYCVGNESVKFAAVLFRHGDRTPVDTYPSDPWRNESLWPVQFGELTNIGKQQHYALGQWLRKRYSHLLSSSFNSTEIYVRSTDVDRTLMSALANLAGMYPPVGNSVWKIDLMWQPIPVHTVPEKDDEVLAMKKPCPAYDKELESVITSEPYKERLLKYQKLMDYLSAHTGIIVKDYYDIVNLYSILYIETLYNFTLPEWTHKVYPDAMAGPAGYSFSTESSTPLLARLKAGPFIKLITSKMMDVKDDIDKLSSTKHPKVLIFSAHDLTVATMLNALGMFDYKCPPYTATVLFELIEAYPKSDLFVRISYRESTKIVEPIVLNIPYCGKLCHLDRFMTLYENLVTVDFDHECENKTSTDHASTCLTHRRLPSLIGFSFFIGLAICATMYVTHKVHFARISNRYRPRMVYNASVRTPPSTTVTTPTSDKPIVDV